MRFNLPGNNARKMYITSGWTVKYAIFGTNKIFYEPKLYNNLKMLVKYYYFLKPVI